MRVTFIPWIALAAIVLGSSEVASPVEGATPVMLTAQDIGEHQR